MPPGGRTYHHQWNSSAWKEKLNLNLTKLFYLITKLQEIGGQGNIFNQTIGMQSAKSRLWETINKQPDFFNKQLERKKIPRYEGGIYSLGEAEKAQNPVTMVGSSKLRKEKEKIMRRLEIWTLTGGYLILNMYLLVLFGWNTNISVLTF